MRVTEIGNIVSQGCYICRYRDLQSDLSILKATQFAEKRQRFSGGYFNTRMQMPVPLFSRRIRWVGVLLIAGLIFYSSLLTVPETVVDDTQPELIPLNYWRHIVAYFVLACGLAYATDHWSLSRWRHAAVVIGIAAGYGILMEAGQALVPHRTPFLLSDVLVNTIGASGVVFWYLIRPYLVLRPVSEYLTATGSSDD